MHVLFLCYVYVILLVFRRNIRIFMYVLSHNKQKANRLIISMDIKIVLFSLKLVTECINVMDNGILCAKDEQTSHTKAVQNEMNDKVLYAKRR